MGSTLEISLMKDWDCFERDFIEEKSECCVQGERLAGSLISLSWFSPFFPWNCAHAIRVSHTPNLALMWNITQQEKLFGIWLLVLLLVSKPKAVYVWEDGGRTGRPQHKRDLAYTGSMCTNMPQNKSLCCQWDAGPYRAKTQPNTGWEIACYLPIYSFHDLNTGGFFVPQASSWFGCSRNLFRSELEDTELSSD